MATLTSEDFESRFTLIPGANPELDGQWSQFHLGQVNPQQRWTVVEGDDGDLYIIPGFHVVNQLGYYVTEEQWTYADLDNEWEW
jgi:hypothetical protein